jgi:hypothetical protein
MAPIEVSVFFSRLVPWIPNVICELTVQQILPWLAMIHLGVLNVTDILHNLNTIKHM